MAKDPAFLFYPGDWMGGTQWMTFEQRGCYIELLILQFNTGQFTEAQAKQVLSICFDLAWPLLKQKFINEGEFYYNERLRAEIEKRKRFTESRRNNGLSPKSTNKETEASAKHMEDENRNKNIVIDFNCIENFKPILTEWFDYKKSKKQTYKNLKSKEKFYQSLVQLSKSNPVIAQKIINQSIANNWAGIFELKENKSNGNQTTISSEAINRAANRQSAI